MTRTPRDADGVHPHEMRTDPTTDELERILADGDDPLAGLLDQLQAHADTAAAPAPGEALSAILVGGLPERSRSAAVAAPARRAPRRRRAVAVAGIGFAVLAGTGVAGALPGPAQRPFDRVADAVGFQRGPSVPAVETPQPAPLVDEVTPGGDVELPPIALERWGSVPWPGTVPSPAPAAGDRSTAPGRLPAPTDADRGEVPAAPPAPADRGAADERPATPAPTPGDRVTPPADGARPEQPTPPVGGGDATADDTRADATPNTTRTPSEAGRRSP